MNIMRFKNLFLAFSIILVLASLVSIGVFRLDLGIDFTGGSILEVEYQERLPSNKEIKESLSGLELGSLSVQETGEKGVLIRMKDITPELHQEVLFLLGKEAQEMRFESIGPVIGQELKGKTLLFVLLSLLAVAAYITFAFRRTIASVPSWQWSLSAIVALLHDTIIPLGVFAILGYLQGVQITIPIVVALLTVVGYSINDTVVVFDRIRENLSRKVGFDFADTVAKSVRQTLFRSFSTSITTLLVLFAIFFLGGETLKYFSLALIIGIIAGTYSSLFLAPVLLVIWRKRT